MNRTLLLRSILKNINGNVIALYKGSLSAIFNIDLDLDPNPMFASMEHMNRNIFNIDLDLDPNLLLHRSEHRVRVKIKVDIENSQKTTYWNQGTLLYLWKRVLRNL